MELPIVLVPMIHVWATPPTLSLSQRVLAYLNLRKIAPGLSTLIYWFPKLNFRMHLSIKTSRVPTTISKIKGVYLGPSLGKTLLTSPMVFHIRIMSME